MSLGKISAGFAIFNKENKLLIVKGTNLRFYDLPKGNIETGETPLQAAIRETKEEVDIWALPTKDEPFHAKYATMNKKITIYLMENFDCSNYVFKCNSTFSNVNSQILPEIAYVEWVTPKEAIEKLHKTAGNIVQQIIEYKNW